jgi:integrase/recombinase XerC
MGKKSTELVSVTDQKLVEKFKEAHQKKIHIEDFINEFLLQFLSNDTKTAYIKDLDFFFNFLKLGNVSIHHPSEIKSFHFQLYRDHLIEKGLASATINRRLVCIRSFIKWAVASKLMDHNPLDTIKLPRVQTESPTVAFDDHEVVKMIEAPDLNHHKGRTHRLIMVLLFNLGLRRSELVNIKLQMIVKDRGHDILNIKGKGDKIRIIPLNSFVLGEIKKYISTLMENGVELNPNDWLIQTELKNKNQIPMDGSTIYRIINRYAKSLGINKCVSPHSCRATVISHLLDTQQAPIRDVATFAGHSNITTTERYDKRRGNLNKSAAYQVDYSTEDSD